MSKELDLNNFVLPKELERFDLVSKKLKTINSQLIKKKFLTEEAKEKSIKNIFSYIFSFFEEEEFSLFLSLLNYFYYKHFQYENIYEELYKHFLCEIFETYNRNQTKNNKSHNNNNNNDKINESEKQNIEVVIKREFITNNFSKEYLFKHLPKEILEHLLSQQFFPKSFLENTKYIYSYIEHEYEQTKSKLISESNKVKIKYESEYDQDNAKILEILQNDDVSELRNFYDKNKISHSYIYHQKLNKTLSILEFSVIFSSIECFEYLLSKNQTITEDTCYYVLKYGTIEII